MTCVRVVAGKSLKSVMESRTMKIAVFTEGTILMHQSAVGHTRNEIVQQVIDKDLLVKDYASYVSIKSATEKIQKWSNQGAEITYITSRKEQKEVDEIQNVLNHNHFPKGALEYRKGNDEYKDIMERIMLDILIEDDCESIGGESEMTYSHINSGLTGLKKEIKSIVVKEFSGIDHLSNDIAVLRD